MLAGRSSRQVAAEGDAVTSVRVSAAAAAAAVGAFLILGATTALAGSDAAHQMADRFAREPSKPRAVSKPVEKRVEPDADQLKSYEDEMLARARAEAEARAKADLAAEEESARRRQAGEAERQRAIAEAEARRAAAVEAARKADEARLAAERDKEVRRLSERLRVIREERRAKLASEAAAKAEADARAATELQARAEAEARIATRKREAERMEALARAEAQAKADARAKAEAEAKARAEAELAARRETEKIEASIRENAAAEHARAVLRERARHLSERIAAIRATRAAEQQATASTARPIAAEQPRSVTEVSAAPQPTASRGEPVIEPRPDAPRARGEARDNTVTVLLVLDAGDRGIRRWNKTADPMLCVGGSCYISNGSDTPAERLTRSKAFGPGVALGKRAGACRNQLGCVFRGVDLGDVREWMQPVDLRIMRHDRREAKLVHADDSCSVERGKLLCDGGVSGDSWRAWIVPEPVARRAGAAALEAALEMSERHAIAGRGDR